MARSNGFIGKTGDVAGITTAYSLSQVILLDDQVTGEVSARQLPGGADLNNLEVEVLVTSGTPTQVFGYLTYDAEGDYFASAEATIDLLTALTTANRKGGCALIAMNKTPPIAQQTAAGRLYLWLKTDTGTVTFKSARLHWKCE